MKLEETGGIGIFDINFDTGERAWSYELRDLFGIPKDAPPDFQLLLQHIHPEDRRDFNTFAIEPFRPDCPARQTRQIRVMRDDGSVHWLHLVRLTIFRDNAVHDAVRVLGFAVEITGPTEHRTASTDYADFTD